MLPVLAKHRWQPTHAGLLQVTEELKRAAMGSQEVEDQQERLKIDQKRLDLQLVQAHEGTALTSVARLQADATQHIKTVPLTCMTCNTFCLHVHRNLCNLRQLS